VVSLHSGTPLGVRTSHGHFGPQDTPRPGLGGSHHLRPYNILCATFQGLHPNGSFSRDSQVGVPKLSRNCPGWSPGTLGAHNSWLSGLNQTCSPRRDLSNAMSHSPFGGQEEVDSRFLVVGSQTASLTLGLSFAHNLGNRCSNGQCEAIFDVYASRPFQWHQKHLNARCFGPCCRTLNIRESRKTPSPQLWECWDSPLHLAKVGLRQLPTIYSTYKPLIIATYCLHGMQTSCSWCLLFGTPIKLLIIINYCLQHQFAFYSP
jgi:hypothetical protein